MKNYSG